MLSFKDSKPLSVEEETALFVKIRNGDIEARNDLITHNLLLVVSIARKFQGDFDDMFCEGVQAMIRAVDKFDEKRGTRFGSYAYFWIKAMIQRHLKRQAEEIHEPEIDVSDGRNDFDQIEAKCDLKNLLKYLNKREREVLMKHYGCDGNGGKPHTFKEIAAVMGCTKQRVEQLHQLGLKKIRLAMERRGRAYDEPSAF